MSLYWRRLADVTSHGSHGASQTYHPRRRLSAFSLKIRCSSASSLRAFGASLAGSAGVCEPFNPSRIRRQSGGFPPPPDFLVKIMFSKSCLRVLFDSRQGPHLYGPSAPPIQLFSSVQVPRIHNSACARKSLPATRSNKSLSLPPFSIEQGQKWNFVGPASERRITPATVEAGIIRNAFSESASEGLNNRSCRPGRLR